MEVIFDFIDEDVLDVVINTLEGIGRKVSEDKFIEIADKIDEAMPGIIERMTIDAHDEWKSRAIEASGWGSKYSDAIKYELSDKKGEVFLDDSIIDKESGKPNIMFAKMMEDGVKSWSIKDALMKSDKAKKGKDGIKYITVPFPVATPRKKGQGKMASKFGKREMTKEIYEIVKKGGRIRDMQINVRGKSIDVSGLQKFVTQKYHAQYGFFRRVSEKSTGWQYPAIGAQPIFSGVEKYVRKRISEIMTEFSQALIKEYSA
jgi:hypothetical protein